MNWVDLSLVLLVAVSAITGVKEGFSRSGFGFVAIVAAFLSAAWLYPANAKAFLAVFVGVICAAALCAFLLGRFLKSAGPEWLDRVLGGAFGLTNAAIFAVFAVMALMAFAPKIPREYIADSRLAPYAVEAARTAAAVVPDEVKTRIEESYAELVHALPPKLRRVMPPAEI